MPPPSRMQSGDRREQETLRSILRLSRVGRRAHWISAVVWPGLLGHESDEHRSKSRPARLSTRDLDLGTVSDATLDRDWLVRDNWICKSVGLARRVLDGGRWHSFRRLDLG